MTQHNTEQLLKRIEELEAIIKPIIGSSKYIFSKDIRIWDGANIIVAPGTGTRIGTAGGASGQKIGFFNAPPVVQQTGVAVSAAGIHAALVNLGLITA